MKRQLTILLSLLLMLTLLTCCAAEEAPQEPSGQAAAVTQKEQLEEDLALMNRLMLLEDTAYYLRHEKLGDTDSYQTLFCRKQGNQAEEVLFACEPEEGKSFYVMGCQVDSQGNWYLLCDRGTSGSSDLTLEKRDSQGKLLTQTPCTDFGPVLSEEMVMDCALDTQGRFLAAACLWWSKRTYLSLPPKRSSPSAAATVRLLFRMLRHL